MIKVTENRIEDVELNKLHESLNVYCTFSWYDTEEKEKGGIEYYAKVELDCQDICEHAYNHEAEAKKYLKEDFDKFIEEMENETIDYQNWAWKLYDSNYVDVYILDEDYEDVGSLKYEIIKYIEREYY